MIDRNGLLGALRGSDLADWVLVERERERAILDEGARSARREAGRRWTMIVHDDAPNGRGSARLEVDAAEGDGGGEIVRAARAAARAAIGPAWASQPPSAPAKLVVADPAWGATELETIARGVVERAKRPKGATVGLIVTAAREHVSVFTKQGLHATWPETRVGVRALVAVGDRSLEIAREARRESDLGLDAALVAAAEDLGQVALAVPAPAGPCVLVLRDEAMLHGGGYGVWEIFAAFADSVVDRKGLTRYRLGTPIARGAEAADEALSIASDARDFGVRSAPVGDEGEAVRGFPLVQRGIALGLGLPPREAALRRLEPNGGVRELVVTKGSWSGEIEAGGGARVVEVRRLRDLTIDRYAGDAQLEIGLAIEHVGGAARPIAGGTVRLDLVAALAGARLAAKVIDRGAYHGPSALMIAGAAIV